MKGAQSLLNGLKSLAKLFNFVVCNPCQSSPSLTILVPLRFIIISLVFFYLCKVLFSGFLQFKGNSIYGQNNSKYCDWAPLNREYNHKIDVQWVQCYWIGSLINCFTWHNLGLLTWLSYLVALVHDCQITSVGFQWSSLKWWNVCSLPLVIMNVHPISLGTWC